jgi:hypothetical protein
MNVRRLGIVVLGATVSTLFLPRSPIDAAVKKTKTSTKASAAKKVAASLKGKKATVAPAVLAVLRVPVVDVLRASASSKSFTASPDQAPVVLGDRLKTDGKGRGWVDFADGSVLRVSTSTEVLVTELAVSQTARRVRVNLTTGSLYAHVAKVSGSDSNWSVETPVGVATARGTAFSVTCTPANCTLAVAEGQVRLSNALGTTDVDAGNQSVTQTNERPAPQTPLTSSADDRGGSWLLCNAQRDAITTPNSSFASPTGPDCDFVLGPKLTPTNGLPAIVVDGSANGPTTSTSPTAAGSPTSTVKAAITTTAVATTTTTTVFPTRASFFTGSGGLTASIVENPFRCNGAAPRTYVTYTGLVPGETLTWVWGIAGQPPDRTGSSSAGGTTGTSIWSCTPAQAGTVWTFTLTGGSGHSITYDLVGGPP